MKCPGCGDPIDVTPLEVWLFTPAADMGPFCDESPYCPRCAAEPRKLKPARFVRCGRCGVAGHNRRSCTT